MNKILLALCLICTGLFFTGCAVADKEPQMGDFSDKTLHYVMDISTEKDIYLPSLDIDKNNQTFSITNDVLSSTIIGGTYKAEDNMFIAETYDKQKVYQFEIIDNDTLKFVQEKSSTFELTDEAIGVAIVDGSIFKLQNE